VQTLRINLGDDAVNLMMAEPSRDVETSSEGEDQSPPDADA
jgi:hypothetical protein